MADMVGIGFRHHGVFTHDVHALDFSFTGGFHHLDHRKAGSCRDIGTPDILRLLPRRRKGYLLVSGNDVGKAAHVAGALNVVLSPEGVHSRAGPSQHAAEKGQVRHGPDVVRPRHVLGDSHGVEDGGIRPLGVCPCCIFDEFRRDAGDFRNVLGSVPRHGLPELLEVVRVLFDELRGMKVLTDDHVHQSVEERHVGTALLPDVDVGVLRHFDLPGIAHDEGALPLPLLFLDEGADDGMVFSGVRADDENGVGRFDGLVIVGHGAASEGLAETRNCGAVSQMGTVVDVIGAHHLPRKALHEIVLFVGAPGG